MPVNNPPFVDDIPTNGLVAPRGSYVWLKSQVTLGGSTTTPPDASSFLVPQLVQILDPDNNDVTAQWVTVVIDPADATDVYDGSHATYVGDEADPDNIGLFHDGLGNLALKVKVPTNAELTYQSSTRRHKVRWSGLTKNGGAIIAVEETFVVSEAGVVTFGSMLITPAMVTAGMVTVMTPEQIGGLVQEASMWVRGRLKDCKADLERAQTTFDERIQTGMILYSRALVFDRDASAGYKVGKAQEGTKRIERAGQSDDTPEGLRLRAKEELSGYCKEYGRRGRPRIGVVRRDLPGSTGCC
jgi:hypothetical protein